MECQREGHTCGLTHLGMLGGARLGRLGTWGESALLFRGPRGPGREGGEREGQEEPLSLTASQLDVTQEPSVSRASPQLPVPLSLLQPVVAEEQDKSVYIAATAVAYSDCTVDIEVKELTQHVEDLSGNQVWRHQDTDRPRGVGGVGEDRGEELQDEDYFPPSQTSSPRSSLSPSPPLPHSLAAMSRIYNLKAVGSRAGLCISERAVEVVSHKTLPQEDYRPFRQKLTQEPSRPKEVQVDHAKVEHPWESSDEPLSVLSVQRQVEQLRLREQEVKRQKLDERQAEKSTSSEKEMKVPQGHWREESQQHHLRSGDGQTRDRPSPTGRRTPPTPQAQPKLNQSKTFSGPSPEGARKHLERPTAPVPPSSPSSLSPSSLVYCLQSLPVCLFFCLTAYFLSTLSVYVEAFVCALSLPAYLALMVLFLDPCVNVSVSVCVCV